MYRVILRIKMEENEFGVMVIDYKLIGNLLLQIGSD